MTARDILLNGLRDNNPGLVQLLGLCPLLAVSTTVVSGLGLGLATVAVLVASNAVAALIGRWLAPEVRIGVFVVAIAGLVTAVELAMAAWLPTMHAALGIFLPLIVTNCLVLARAEAFAARQPLANAILDGLAMGCGFLLVLLVLGACREWLGHAWLLALLPPGAFILLGLLIALRNWQGAARGEPSRERATVQPATRAPS